MVLRSPVRFCGAVAVLSTMVFAALFGVRVLIEFAGTRASPAIDSGASESTQQVRQPDVPAELPPSRTLPLETAPESALAVAQRWIQSWSSPEPPTEWLDGLRNLTTEKYLGVLDTVDPANVPRVRITGSARAVEVRPKSLLAKIPTDKMVVELLLVEVAEGDRRVAAHQQVQ